MDEPNYVEKIKLLKLWRSWIKDYVIIIMTTLDDIDDDNVDDTLTMKDDSIF